MKTHNKTSWKSALVAAVVCSAMSLGLTALAQAQDLNIDFNSTSQDGGPHNATGYQAYDAAHETTADFDTKSYSAFSTTVSVTPAWTNTTDSNVQQMIDRGDQSTDPVGSWDANWTDTNLDLVTDFIGIDTRTGNGGNGDYDGTTGTPTYMTLALFGLPTGDYAWKSYHQDTENVHTFFQVELSTDGGANFTSLADGYMSDSGPGGNPDSALDGSPGLVTDFAGMASVGSIYETTFSADGTNDVVLRFAPLSGQFGAVHNQIWGMNGFEVTSAAVVPEPGSLAVLSIVGIGIFVRRRR